MPVQLPQLPSVLESERRAVELGGGRNNAPDTTQNRLKANREMADVDGTAAIADRNKGKTALIKLAGDTQRAYGEDFAPLATQLRRTALGTDAKQVLAGIKADGTTANRTSDVAAGAFGRERSGLGLAGPSASDTRRLGLARVLAQVDTENRSTMSAQQRQKDAQAYGLQAYGTAQSDATQALASIAKSEADRENQFKEAKASKTQSGIQTLTTVGSMALMAFSDRRAKKNIHEVGETPGGIKLYSFNYIWQDEGSTEYIGVMADEVAHIPGAVIRGLFDRVDYSKVL